MYRNCVHLYCEIGQLLKNWREKWTKWKIFARISRVCRMLIYINMLFAYNLWLFGRCPVCFPGVDRYKSKFGTCAKSETRPQIAGTLKIANEAKAQPKIVFFFCVFWNVCESNVNHSPKISTHTHTQRVTEIFGGISIMVVYCKRGFESV